MVNRVLVVGGGSAGFLAAIALKTKLPMLAVSLIRSKDIGIIGVGEGTTAFVPNFLHGHLGIDPGEFYRVAQPQWKLGIRFLWGPRPVFDYSFGKQLDAQYRGLEKTNAFYCADRPFEDLLIYSSLMANNRAFLRTQDNRPLINDETAYHIENEKFVTFLEMHAQRIGVQIIDDTITGVEEDENGVKAIRTATGRTLDADLYVDSSGFYSVLIGKTFKEPFIPFKSTLFCDRAVIGGWKREEEPIQPYTVAETMDAGWAWRIDHEFHINRGYVYSSAFISDEEAEREYRRKNPKVGNTRIVKFTTGRYARTWVKNVVGIGNAAGFVEPLEATSLAVICAEAHWLTAALTDCDREVRPTQVKYFNQAAEHLWEIIRQFLGMHYRFNTRLDTSFWRECRERTDLCEGQEIVDFYRENGPSALWKQVMCKAEDHFAMEGYFAMLVGQNVPFKRTHQTTAREMELLARYKAEVQTVVGRAFTVPEALARVRSPEWTWGTGQLRPVA